MPRPMERAPYPARTCAWEGKCGLFGRAAVSSDIVKAEGSRAAAGSVAIVTGRSHRGKARPSLGGGPDCGRDRPGDKPNQAWPCLSPRDEDLGIRRRSGGTVRCSDWHDKEAPENIRRRDIGNARRVGVDSVFYGMVLSTFLSHPTLRHVSQSQRARSRASAMRSEGVQGPPTFKLSR